MLIIRVVVWFTNFINKMSVDEPRSREHEALRSLLEISNQKEEDDDLQPKWKNNRLRKKHKSLHKPKVVDNEQPLVSRSEKLPLIPNKNNFEHKPLLSSSRVSHCLILDKGLGVFNSVQIKKGRGQGRYLENTHNYIKLYSESNEQEYELILHWLKAKKQSCRSYQFLACKKQKTKPQMVNNHLSIKHLL